MRVVINNIGILKKEEVICDDITLITGKNGSGKSTFAKALSSLYGGINNSFKNYNYYFLLYSRDKVMEKLGIRRIIYSRTLSRESTPYLSKILRGTKKDVPQNFPLYFDSLINEINFNAEEIRKVLKRYRENTIFDLIPSEDNNDNSINLLLETINELKIQYEDSNFYNNYVCQTIKEQMDYSFSGQVKNIKFPKDDSYIEILDNNLKFGFHYDNKVVHFLEKRYRNVFYIDDACIIDELYKKNYLFNKSLVSSLQEYLKNGLEESVNSLLKIEIKSRYNELFELIDSVYPYDFVGEKSLITTNNGVHISNEACGKKIFVLIKEMLYRGLINADSILIFDEPDNHLHPEWQVKFAELIFKINKIIGTKVFVITHSPTLLLAFQVYSKRNEALRVYFCDQKNETIFLDVTNNIERAHKELSDPYINLDMFGSSLK